jgi:excisionase family DNA binding protein
LDPLLTLRETATLLGVCPTTVRRYTNRGKLAHIRTGGNQRRFRLSHVLEFMERQAEAAERSDRGAKRPKQTDSSSGSE